MSLPSRLKALFDRSALNKEIDEEIASHIDMRTADNIAAGMPEVEARREARLRFGNPNLIREKVAAVDAVLSPEVLWADLRLAVRRLLKSRGFTATAVLILALGIGVNTAIFSIVEAVLLRPLSYKNPERLVVVWQADVAHRGTGGWFNAYREFEVWQQNSRSFEKLAPLTWATEGSALLWDNKPVNLLPIPSGVNFFSVLGVSASLGRTFFESDLSNSCTLVLSHRFWQFKLGSPIGIVGQTLTMGGKACHVVGVMPSDFSFYPLQADAWSLIGPTSDFVLKPWTSMTGVFGLLKPGVTRAQAEAELHALQARISVEAPAETGVLRTLTPTVLDLQSNFTWLAGRNLKTALWVLLGAVLIILLMACVNTATLLLGRAGERAREMAVRAALGSGRARLFGQFFAEVLLLSFSATLVGLGLAALLLAWFRSASPIELPPGNVVALNWSVFLYTALLGIGCALLTGVLPAFHGSQSDLSVVLKTGERGQGSSAPMQRVAQWFIVLQVALSLTLLTAASSLGESLLKLSSTKLGYRTDQLLTARINLPPGRYPDDSAKTRFLENLSEKIASEGVLSSTLASGVTPTGTNVFTIEGRLPNDTAADGVAVQDVSPSFFRLMRIPIISGRAFDTRDRQEAQETVIINRALASKYFKNADPLGKTLKLSRAEDQTKPWMTIVGIVGDVKTNTVFQDMGYVEQPAVYRAILQDPPTSLVVITQTAKDENASISRLQAALSKIDNDLVLNSVETIEQKQAAILSQPRFRAVLFGGFALLALSLAMVGLYGVLLQAVLQRTREIGIRMALGATRRRILEFVLTRAIKIIGLGLIAGMAGSIMCGVFFRSLLYGVDARNPLLLCLASFTLLIVGVIAALQPALHASSVDPVRALRSE